MSRNDLHSFLITLLGTVSAARIADATGYSDAAISQVKNGRYAGDDTIILQAVFAVFGKWDCPALMIVIGLDECRAEMARPYSSGRVRQWAICQKCDRREK